MPPHTVLTVGRRQFDSAAKCPAARSSGVRRDRGPSELGFGRRRPRSARDARAHSIGAHPLDDDLWERVQAIRFERATPGTRGARERVYMLASGPHRHSGGAQEKTPETETGTLRCFGRGERSRGFTIQSERSSRTAARQERSQLCSPVLGDRVGSPLPHPSDPRDIRWAWTASRIVADRRCGVDPVSWPHQPSMKAGQLLCGR